MKWEFTRAAAGRPASTSSATPTRASRAPSRTACILTERAGPGVRGHDHRRLRDRRRPRASCTCAASTPTCAPSSSSVLAAAARRGPARQERRRQGGLRLRHPHPDGRRRLRLRRGDRAASAPARACAATPRTARRSRPRRATSASPTCGQQRRDLLLRGPRSWSRAPAGSPSIGSKGSPGTKLLSISGDCKRPGVYEVPFGITLAERAEAGGRRGRDRRAGRRPERPDDRPDGVRPHDLLRRPGHRRLGHGLRPGARPARDRRHVLHGVLRRRELRLLHAVPGRATCCCKERLDAILRRPRRAGRPRLPARSSARRSRPPSRCGLGQTSPNPVLDLAGELPRRSTRRGRSRRRTGAPPAFDLAAAVRRGRGIAGRTSSHRSSG